MGFVIKYVYKQSGLDEEQSASVKVGKADDDVPVEKVAGRIMGIYAMPGREVISLSVLEHTTKEVSFKRQEDGISVKGKKFRFDRAPAPDEETESELKKQLAELMIKVQMLSQERSSDSDGSGFHIPPHNTAPKAQVPSQPHNKLQPRERARPTSKTQTKMVVFNPVDDRYHVKELASRGMRLSIGREYRVNNVRYSPSPGSSDDGEESAYEIESDDGKLGWVDSAHFEANRRSLWDGYDIHQEPGYIRQ